MWAQYLTGLGHHWSRLPQEIQVEILKICITIPQFHGGYRPTEMSQTYSHPSQLRLISMEWNILVCSHPSLWAHIGWCSQTTIGTFKLHLERSGSVPLHFFLCDHNISFRSLKEICTILQDNLHRFQVIHINSQNISKIFNIIMHLHVPAHQLQHLALHCGELYIHASHVLTPEHAESVSNIFHNESPLLHTVITGHHIYSFLPISLRHRITLLDLSDMQSRVPQLARNHRRPWENGRINLSALMTLLRETPSIEALRIDGLLMDIFSGPDEINLLLLQSEPIITCPRLKTLQISSLSPDCAIVLFEKLDMPAIKHLSLLQEPFYIRSYRAQQYNLSCTDAYKSNKESDEPHTHITPLNSLVHLEISLALSYQKLVDLLLRSPNVQHITVSNEQGDKAADQIIMILGVGSMLDSRDGDVVRLPNLRRLDIKRSARTLSDDGSCLARNLIQLASFQLATISVLGDAPEVQFFLKVTISGHRSDDIGARVYRRLHREFKDKIAKHMFYVVCCGFFLIINTSARLRNYDPLSTSMFLHS